MTEQLFSVGIQHIKTGERINLEVWAKNVHEATHELHGVIGPYTQYRWTGSGPGGSGPKQRPGAVVGNHNAP